MFDTRLVQRFDRKPESAFAAKVSRVFGGGMLQLQDKAWDLLQQHIDIHYMGAAEYEFGILPRTLQSLILAREELVTFEMVLQREDVKLNSAHEHNHRMNRRRELEEARKAGVKAKRAKPYKDPNFTPKTVYVLCRKAQRTRVEETIRKLALGKVFTKERHCFDEVLDPSERWDTKTIGWLELDNGFMFFTDKTAFEGISGLFLGTETEPAGVAEGA